MQKIVENIASYKKYNDFFNKYPKIWKNFLQNAIFLQNFFRNFFKFLLLRNMRKSKFHGKNFVKLSFGNHQY